MGRGGQVGRGAGRMPSRIAMEAQRDLAWVDVGSGVQLMRVQPLQVQKCCRGREKGGGRVEGWRGGGGVLGMGWENDGKT